MISHEYWQPTRLGDLVSIKHGWPFKSQYMTEYLPGRPIVVSIGNFEYSGGFRFRSTTIKAYTGDYPKEFVLKPSDVLLIMTCQTAGGEILGIPGRIPNDDHVYLHNQRMGKVIIKDGKKVDIDFLYWLFLQSDFNRHLVATATGAKILHTAPERIESFKFLLPPLPTQRKIADILSAYDDLIENNTRRIAILEEMAQSLYQEWFVKFRFPGYEKVEMVESEMGLVPEGWKAARLANLVDTQYGYTESADEAPIGPRYLRGMDINKTSYIYWDAVPYCPISRDNHNKYRLAIGDILVIRMADPGKVGIVEKNIDAVFASYLIRLHIKLASISPYYLFYFLRSDRYHNYVNGASTGATRKSASAGVITDIDIVIPTDEILSNFESYISSLRTTLNNLLDKNANLRQTRDLLLPKLISGEIDVSSWVEGEPEGVGEIEALLEGKVGSVVKKQEVAEPIDREGLVRHSLWE